MKFIIPLKLRCNVKLLKITCTSWCMLNLYQRRTLYPWSKYKYCIPFTSLCVIPRHKSNYVEGSYTPIHMCYYMNRAWNASTVTYVLSHTFLESLNHQLDTCILLVTVIQHACLHTYPHTYANLLVIAMALPLESPS